MKVSVSTGGELGRVARGTAARKATPPASTGSASPTSRAAGGLRAASGPLTGLREDDLARATPPGLPELMSTNDVAELFGRNERSIRRWVRKGVLHPLKVSGSLFFRADEIRNLIASVVEASLPDRFATSDEAA